MNLYPRIRKAVTWLLLGSSVGLMVEPAGAALSISETPLFLTVSVAPNVIVTLDDSGSMARAYAPDLCGGSGYVCATLTNRWTKSSRGNAMYYNPNITYPPPLKEDGTPLSTSFTAAYVNGFDPAWGTPVNLGSDYRPTAMLYFPSAGGRNHQYMSHYTATTDLTKPTATGSHTDTGMMVGVNDGGSTAPRFAITDFVNADGSASGEDPGTNLISVTVNGTAATDVGTFDLPCTNGNDPGSNDQYKTNISGTTLTLCFRDRDAMYGKTVVVTHKVSGAGTAPVTATDPTTAYYYVFDSSNSGCDGTDQDNDCYDVKIVGSASGPSGTDERQNFANWYSFYRTRNLATMAAASRAFVDFDPSTRLAWQALNSCRGSASSLVTTDCEGWETTSTNFSNAIKPFTGTHRQNFYKWLFRQKTNNSTPLKAATLRAGAYFSTTGENSPYDDDLTAAGSVSGSSGQLSCRKNFHILMTDGVWNESTTVPSPIDKADNSLAAPYKGATSSTLADIAYYYWATDLTTLTNNLTRFMPAKEKTDALAYANPRNDPATHQHMVNYTVGLGLGSFLIESGLTWGGDTYSGSFIAINGGTPWPVPSNNSENNVSDLWHAAINSRGRFYSADDPKSLIEAFASIGSAIRDAEPSAAALAANSTSIEGDAYVYQAIFSSSDWSGDLKAFPVSDKGVVSETPTWTASGKMPAAASRNIYTINGSSGVDFNWGELSVAKQTALNTNASGTVDSLGEDRLNWLRGVQTKEESKSGGVFRNRATILGDIINSDPAYAYQEDFGYATMKGTTAAEAEASLYAAYVSGKSLRTAAVFVGGNDGMLHAFRADTSTDAGTELFAFVPNAAYATLSKLTDPAYSHKYFVDAGPTLGDAYFDGGWKTMLVGGLGGGGQSVYALDVSNVASPSASMVKWEYTDTDLGLTYSKPQIVRLNNGAWAAVFGNGFNSTTDKAFLYIVDIGTGTLIKKIPVGPSISANGLSTPVLYDANEDKIMDLAYVGDLQGNLWKIDLGSDDEDDWAVAYSGVPLFTARNASGEVQPIHSQPVLGSEPTPSAPTGVMVYFGTGQYLEGDDVSDKTVQSFYGIWDSGSAIATTDRSALQQQTISATTKEFGREVRETSANTVDWTSKRGWYMDFDVTDSAGERVVTQALLRYDRVIFLTLIPSTEVCNPDGESWLMELDALTGSRTAVSSFDFSGDPSGGFDGSFDSADLLASGATASGIKTTVGITKTPAWFTGDSGKDYKVLTGTTGGIESVGNKGGGSPPPPGGVGTLRRTYWLQIQ